MSQLLIIGGSDAGISAALRAREIDPSVNVAVVVADAFPNYSICGLPFYVSGEVPDWHSLAHRTREEIEREGIRLLLNHTARAIDSVKKTVEVDDTTGRVQSLSYDRLVIATGAAPIRPPIAGLDLPGVYLLHTMEDSFRIHAHVTERHSQSALIVGGGYIGLEMAEALGHLGLKVVLIEALPHVMPPVDPDIAEHIEKELTSRGVELHLEEPVQGFEGNGSVKRVVTGQAGYDVDFVVLAIGVRASSRLAGEAGVPIGATGAIQVDASMATSVPDVYAAGDTAEAHHLVTGRPAYIPLGTTANKQGRVAGENAAGGRLSFEGIVGTAITRVFELEVGRTGLTEGQAREAGFDPVSSVITHRSRAAFFPGSQPITAKLIADRTSGRLLGAQVAGKDGAAKRIDVPAVAIQQGLPASALPDLDLSYAPPFSPVWEAVQIAAQDLEKKLVPRG